MNRLLNVILRPLCCDRLAPHAVSRSCRTHALRLLRSLCEGENLMPCYDLKCQKCGREFEQFARVHERNAQSCPACGAKCEVVVGKANPAFARSTNAAWGMSGGQSLRFAFAPGSTTVYRDLPSARIHPKTGALIYDSDRHQRQVFKEMGYAKAKYEEREARKAEKARRESGDRFPDHPIDLIPSGLGI